MTLTMSLNVVTYWLKEDFDRAEYSDPITLVPCRIEILDAPEEQP